MIVYRQWEKRMFPRNSLLGRRTWDYEGWFLFGVIPLYIRRMGIK